MPEITAPIVDFATSQIGSYGLLVVFLLMMEQRRRIPLAPDPVATEEGAA